MEYISQFIDYLKERNLSPNTIKVYNDNLIEFWKVAVKSQSIRSITRGHIRDFLVFLGDKANQPITKRAKLTTIRSFFRYLEDEEIIKANPTKNLPLPKVLIKEPQYFLDTDIKKLLNAVKNDKRAEVAIRILAETGIRLSELTNLSVGDIDTKSQTIKVRRKGNIEQILPINSGLNKLLKSYIKGEDNVAPIVANRSEKRMTQRRVAIMIQDYLKIANIDRAGLSVHSFRHAYCVRLLQKKVNLKTIQMLCGHRSIVTTERYLHIANPELRKGVEMARIH